MSDPAPPPTRSERYNLRALYETSRLLSKSLDLEFVLNSLLLTVMSKVLTTRGVVLTHEPLQGGYRVSAVKGVKGVEEGDVLTLPDEPEDLVLVDDDVPTTLKKHGMKLAVPIYFGKREIGMLAVGPKATSEPFSSFELEFVRSLVNMSSTAVHNSLMVEELQLANRDLDAKVQELNTLFDLSQEFNATIDRERLVKLLSFALMGQLLVTRHMFLLRRNAGDDESAIFVTSSKGVSEDVEAELIEKLCRLDKLLLLEDGSASLTGERGVALAANGDGSWGRLRDRGLVLALPLKHQGRTCGALCLGPKRTGQPYTPGDVEFLSALGNLALVSIQNSFLVEEQIEKERLEEEMRLARRIQERLFPQKLPTVDGYEIAALAEPSRTVGGDYYDVVRLEGGRLLAAVADVTGKGVPASLLMANLQAGLHVMLPMDLSIEQAVGHLNRVISENTDYDKFITFFAAIVDCEAGTMDYVNAGHNPPMLVRRDGTVELLEAGGLLLGVMKSTTYERGTVELEPGDVVVFFTDGVTEAMSPGGEEYEEHRLEEVLRKTREQPAGEIMKRVRADIEAFTGDVSELSDDLT
ncbi:MAG: SpoIIE family protein phosphatase, partial [Rhodothermales bacterium]